MNTSCCGRRFCLLGPASRAVYFFLGEGCAGCVYPGCLGQVVRQLSFQKQNMNNFQVAEEFGHYTVSSLHPPQFSILKAWSDNHRHYLRSLIRVFRCGCEAAHEKRQF